jgi:hypothetical protein
MLRGLNIRAFTGSIEFAHRQRPVHELESQLVLTAMLTGKFKEVRYESCSVSRLPMFAVGFIAMSVDAQLSIPQQPCIHRKGLSTLSSLDRILDQARPFQRALT